MFSFLWASAAWAAAVGYRIRFREQVVIHQLPTSMPLLLLPGAALLLIILRRHWPLHFPSTKLANELK